MRCPCPINTCLGARHDAPIVASRHLLDRADPPATAAALLRQLLSKNPRSIARTIAPSLKLNSRSRLSKRLRRPQQRSGKWLLTLKEYRSINKALSMELLCASLLAHLNSAESVVSLCCSDGGTPYNFAPAGLPDLTAEYAQDIRLVAEVSAKADAGLEFQQGQLEQALRHAYGELESSGADFVYALVVNRGDFGGDRKLQRRYASFVSKNELALDGPVRLVPMSGNDLAAVLMNLSERHPKDGMQFSSEALFNGFDQIINGLLQPTPPSKPGWMAELLVRSAWDDWGRGDGGPPPPPSAPRRRSSGPGLT